jgi:hypothetical protein
VTDGSDRFLTGLRRSLLRAVLPLTLHPLADTTAARTVRAMLPVPGHPDCGRVVVWDATASTRTVAYDLPLTEADGNIPPHVLTAVLREADARMAGIRPGPDHHPEPLFGAPTVDCRAAAHRAASRYRPSDFLFAAVQTFAWPWPDDEDDEDDEGQEDDTVTLDGFALIDDGRLRLYVAGDCRRPLPIGSGRIGVDIAAGDADGDREPGVTALQMVLASLLAGDVPAEDVHRVHGDPYCEVLVDLLRW